VVDAILACLYRKCVVIHSGHHTSVVIVMGGRDFGLFV
jgi:hypothetical protein